MTKRTTTSQTKPATESKRLKLNKQTIKDLSVREGQGIKGGRPRNCTGPISGC